MPPQLNPADVIARANRDLERSLLRARNGLRYVRGTHRPQLGATPKDVVWQRDKAQLWRYRGGPIRYAQPLLIVTSLVSRSYIPRPAGPAAAPSSSLRDEGFDVLPARLGGPGRGRRREHAGRPTSTSTCRRRRRRRPPFRLRRGHDRRLLPRRRAVRSSTSPASRHGCGTWYHGDPVDLHEMGAMVAAIREGRLDPDDLHRRDRQRPRRRPAQRLQHARPTDRRRSTPTLLRTTLERRVRQGFRAMAQWARDHVPFPVPRSATHRGDASAATADATGTVPGSAAATDRPPADTHANVLNAMAEQDTVVPSAAAQPIAGWSAGRTAARAAAARRPRHLRHRPLRLQAHAPRLAGGSRAQRRRESMMEIRQLASIASRWSDSCGAPPRATDVLNETSMIPRWSTLRAAGNRACSPRRGRSAESSGSAVADFQAKVARGPLRRSSRFACRSRLRGLSPPT